MSNNHDMTVTEYVEDRIKFLEEREGFPQELACIQFALKELRMLKDFINTPVQSCDDNGCNIKWREL